MSEQTTDNAGGLMTRAIFLIAVLWLGGFCAHAAYVNHNHREPAIEELLELQIHRNDQVAEEKAIHRIEVADCRMSNMLWFNPFQDKCDEWERTFSRYDAEATPESVNRDREMGTQGNHRGDARP